MLSLNNFISLNIDDNPNFKFKIVDLTDISKYYYDLNILYNDKDKSNFSKRIEKIKNFFSDDEFEQNTKNSFRKIITKMIENQPEKVENSIALFKIDEISSLNREVDLNFKEYVIKSRSDVIIFCYVKQITIAYESSSSNIICFIEEHNNMNLNLSSNFRNYYTYYHTSKEYLKNFSRKKFNIFMISGFAISLFVFYYFKADISNIVENLHSSMLKIIDNTFKPLDILNINSTINLPINQTIGILLESGLASYDTYNRYDENRNINNKFAKKFGKSKIDFYQSSCVMCRKQSCEKEKFLISNMASDEIKNFEKFNFTDHNYNKVTSVKYEDNIVIISNKNNYQNTITIKNKKIYTTKIVKDNYKGSSVTDVLNLTTQDENNKLNEDYDEKSLSILKESIDEINSFSKLNIDFETSKLDLEFFKDIFKKINKEGLYSLTDNEYKNITNKNKPQSDDDRIDNFKLKDYFGINNDYFVNFLVNNVKNISDLKDISDEEKNEKLDDIIRIDLCSQTNSFTLYGKLLFLIFILNKGMDFALIREKLSKTDNDMNKLSLSVLDDDNIKIFQKVNKILTVNEIEFISVNEINDEIKNLKEKLVLKTFIKKYQIDSIEYRFLDKIFKNEIMKSLDEKTSLKNIIMFSSENNNIFPNKLFLIYKFFRLFFLKHKSQALKMKKNERYELYEKVFFSKVNGMYDFSIILDKNSDNLPKYEIPEKDEEVLQNSISENYLNTFNQLKTEKAEKVNKRFISFYNSFTEKLYLQSFGIILKNIKNKIIYIFDISKFDYKLEFDNYVLLNNLANIDSEKIKKIYLTLKQIIESLMENLITLFTFTFQNLFSKFNFKIDFTLMPYINYLKEKILDNSKLFIEKKGLKIIESLGLKNLSIENIIIKLREISAKIKDTFISDNSAGDVLYGSEEKNSYFVSISNQISNFINFITDSFKMIPFINKFNNYTSYSGDQVTIKTENISKILEASKKFSVNSSKLIINEKSGLTWYNTMIETDFIKKTFNESNLAKLNFRNTTDEIRNSIKKIKKKDYDTISKYMKFNYKSVGLFYRYISENSVTKYLSEFKVSYFNSSIEYLYSSFENIKKYLDKLSLEDESNFKNVGFVENILDYTKYGAYNLVSYKFSEYNFSKKILLSTMLTTFINTLMSVFYGTDIINLITISFIDSLAISTVSSTDSKYSVSSILFNIIYRFFYKSNTEDLDDIRFMKGSFKSWLLGYLGKAFGITKNTSFRTKLIIFILSIIIGFFFVFMLGTGYGLMLSLSFLSLSMMQIFLFIFNSIKTNIVSTVYLMTSKISQMLNISLYLQIFLIVIRRIIDPTNFTNYSTIFLSFEYGLILKEYNLNIVRNMKNNKDNFLLYHLKYFLKFPGTISENNFKSIKFKNILKSLSESFQEIDTTKKKLKNAKYKYEKFLEFVFEFINKFEEDFNKLHTDLEIENFNIIDDEMYDQILTRIIFLKFFKSYLELLSNDNYVNDNSTNIKSEIDKYIKFNINILNSFKIENSSELGYNRKYKYNFYDLNELKYIKETNSTLEDKIIKFKKEYYDNIMKEENEKIINLYKSDNLGIINNNYMEKLKIETIDKFKIIEEDNKLSKNEENMFCKFLLSTYLEVENIRYTRRKNINMYLKFSEIIKLFKLEDETTWKYNTEIIKNINKILNLSNVNKILNLSFTNVEKMLDFFLINIEREIRINFSRKIENIDYHKYSYMFLEDEKYNLNNFIISENFKYNYHDSHIFTPESIINNLVFGNGEINHSTINYLENNYSSDNYLTSNYFLDFKNIGQSCTYIKENTKYFNFIRNKSYNDFKINFKNLFIITNLLNIDADLFIPGEINFKSIIINNNTIDLNDLTKLLKIKFFKKERKEFGLKFDKIISTNNKNKHEKLYNIMISELKFIIFYKVKNLEKIDNFIEKLDKLKYNTTNITNLSELDDSMIQIFKKFIDKDYNIDTIEKYIPTIFQNTDRKDKFIPVLIKN